MLALQRLRSQPTTKELVTTAKDRQRRRFTFHAACFLLLLRNDNILLLRRYHTGREDGNYTLVSGHIDGGETVIEAMVREAREEVGIRIRKADLRIVHAMHRKSSSEYFDFFLVTRRWTGNPRNQEPDKCDELRWAPLASLPDNLIPSVRKAIEYSQQHVYFSSYGWKPEPHD